MLGNECNLQCKYCIQHDIVNDAVPHGVNQNVINYIKNILDHQKSKVKVTFYGGEPLIFWKDVTQYVQKLKDKNIAFNLITNGKLLTQDKIDFINENKMSIGLSYDGENSIQTRGYDVLSDKKDLVLQIKRLCITGVITKFNYPQDWFNTVMEFDKEYVKKHHYHVHTNLDLLLNNNDLHGLSDFDFEKLECQMEKICDHYLDVQVNDKPIIISDIFIEKFFDMMIIKYKGNYSKCRNGINNLNIDTEGNLYLCHNTHIKVGTIKDDFLDVLKNVFKLDKTSEKQACKECEFRNLCRGGCMLSSQETLDGYFCKLAKAYFKPIVELRKHFYF